MSVRVRPNRAEVRDALLSAASAEFLAHGYQGTTVEKIATAAGFTKGAAYSNFVNKAGLLTAAALRTSANQTVVVADEVFGSELTVARIAERLSRTVRDNAPWAVVLTEVGALARHDDEVAQAYASIRQQQHEAMVEQLSHDRLALGVTPDVAAIVLQITLAQLSFELATAASLWPDSRIAAVLGCVVKGLLA